VADNEIININAEQWADEVFVKVSDEIGVFSAFPGCGDGKGGFSNRNKRRNKWPFSLVRSGDYRHLMSASKRPFVFFAVFGKIPAFNRIF
jgi:hypothetical protein